MSPSHKKQKLSENGRSTVTIGITDPNDIPHADATGKQPVSRTLFVRSLPTSTTSEHLAEFFSQDAVLKHATAVLDKATGSCKGYGFVTFADIEDAQRIKTALDGQKLAGQPVQIEFAEPRHRDSAIHTGDTSERKTTRTSNNVIESLPPPRLIVRNLPWSVKEPEQLAQLFTSYGKIKDVKLPKGKSGALRGFGFVLLRGRRNAEKALSTVNGRELDGRTLAVDWAAPKDVWEQKQSTLLASTPQPGYTLAVQGTDSEDDMAGSDEYSGDMSATSPSSGSEAEDYDSDSLHADEDQSLITEEDDGFIEEDKSKTLFVRNIPFSIDDSALYAHFRTFGPLRYARIVVDYSVGDEGRSRGTGFVCFHQIEDARSCLREAPKLKPSSKIDDGRGMKQQSMLEDTQRDPTGRYTVDGRLLHVSQCVNRNQAQKFEAEAKTTRNKEDKRRLYLLKEGNIPPSSPLAKLVPPSEAKIREASAKQRQDLVRRNPSLHISLTRLAVRNIPRFVTSKDLKALARQGVVGFATDVKEGRRQPLNKEELSRTTEAVKDAERQRRSKGKGIVKQAKVIYETREGNKVTEKSAGGRSRGYGFIEYTSHRCALMGLRWLNGFLVKPSTSSTDQIHEQKDLARRLIVEFAIENAQVVQRRREREVKSRGYSDKARNTERHIGQPDNDPKGVKRPREKDSEAVNNLERGHSSKKTDNTNSARQKIIGRKRAKRKIRRMGH